MPYKDKETLYAKQEELRVRMRQHVLQYLIDNPCVECGESDPRVLDFDHLDPSTKKYNIARMLSGHAGWKKIMSEIEKCRVLCANCHRKHTYVQQGYWGKG